MAASHRQEVASRLEDLELVLGEAARREQGEDDLRPDTVKVRDSVSNPQGADPPPPSSTRSEGR